MQIVISHSNHTYVREIKELLIKQGAESIQVFNNGFKTLQYIIENYSKLILIEEELPGLNAKDIKKALLFKGIKSMVITIKSEKEIYNLFIENTIITVDEVLSLFKSQINK
ncbi:hypothetical protein [Tenacibaculum amylolyticum]|uniref:hypothetical protein n=1 Tax=Tenacibaculum amylolyticum TaxID=104269 RepID=UPI0038939533